MFKRETDLRLMAFSFETTPSGRGPLLAGLGNMSRPARRALMHMTREARAVVWLFVVASAWGAPASPTEVPASPVAGGEAAAVASALERLTNAERSDAGLLTMMDKLTRDQSRSSDACSCR